MDSQITSCRLIWFFHMFVKETMKTLFAPIIVTLYHNKVFWNNWNTVFAQLLQLIKNSKFASFWSILSFYFLRMKILQIKNGKALNLTTVFSLSYLAITILKRYVTLWVQVQVAHFETRESAIIRMSSKKYWHWT